MAPLSVITRLEIPEAARNHRFVTEALACAMVLQANEDPRHQVVGTEETQACELYGWAPNVAPHCDNTGWTYLAPINEGVSYVHCRLKMRQFGHGLSTSVRVQAGDVVRLDDRFEHWTEDACCRVAAFVGSWEQPCDELAIAKLKEGIAQLSAGDYYGAPRVRQGFRAPQPDERYVAASDMSDYELVLAKDVGRRFVITCHCGDPAVAIDPHWPHHWDLCRCQKHLVGAPAEPRLKVTP